MKVFQEALEASTSGRGLLEITDLVGQVVRRSGIKSGTVHVFCHHTSASLVIMENADASARRDLEHFFARLAPDGDPRYEHSMEGPDDMAAHLRMVLTHTSETLPISDGQLLTGTWQGLFLWEHRRAPHRRRLTVTVQGNSDT